MPTSVANDFTGQRVLWTKRGHLACPPSSERRCTSKEMRFAQSTAQIQTAHRHTSLRRRGVTSTAPRLAPSRRNRHSSGNGGSSTARSGGRRDQERRERREVPNNADGIYQRKDRPGFWITWIDAQGRRRRRKTEARTLAQAKIARSAKVTRAETAKALGFAPSGEETFAEVAKSFLTHQRARLSSAGYERERGIVEDHLRPFSNLPIRGIRRRDVQRYVTKRCGEAKAETVRKELNALKHLLTGDRVGDYSGEHRYGCEGTKGASRQSALPTAD